MSWKDFGFLVPTLLILQVVRLHFGESARWLAVVGLLLLALVWGWRARRRWARRIARLQARSPSARDAELQSMPTDEQSAARIVLGMVTSAQANVDPVRGEVFQYPRTPETLLLATFWGCILMSALPLTLLALERVQPDQVWWALAVGGGFGIAAHAILRCRDAERTTIRVSPSGVHEERADGRKVGILWSEVVLVRNRVLWSRIEIWAANGRSIQVGYTLSGFGRFMELLVAYSRYTEERAA